MIPIRYNLRNLIVKKTTTSATAAGIAIVVFVLASTDMLSRAVSESAARYGSADTVVVFRKSADNEFSSMIGDEEARIVNTLPGVRSADGEPLTSSETIVSVTVPDGSGKRVNIQVRGVPDNVMAVRDKVAIIEGRPLHGGVDEAVIGERLNGRLPELILGGSIRLRDRSLKIVGVFRSGTAYDSELWAERDNLRRAFHREGQISSVYAKLTSPTAIPSFVAALESDKRLGLQAVSEREYFERQTDGTASIITGLGRLVTVCFGIAAMIGAMITMFAATANRSREIGTLRALGFSRASILTAFLFESIAMALAGGAVGVLASMSLAFARISVMQVASRTETVLTFQPDPAVLINALVWALVMGTFGGLLPAVRAARLSPVVAMRG